MSDGLMLTVVDPHAGDACLFQFGLISAFNNFMNFATFRVEVIPELLFQTHLRKILKDFNTKEKLSIQLH